MTDEKVYSKVDDRGLKNNLVDSPIWKDAHTEDEIENKKDYIEYNIRFDGLKPIQVLKINRPNEKGKKNTKGH